MRHLQGDHDGSALRIGVVVSRFNESVTEALLKGALEGLDEAKVPPESVTIASVPGAFELAGTASRFAASGAVDAVVCIGAVIRGQTDHFTFVAAAAQEGILRVSIDTGIPIIFGVLTTDDYEQAEDRAGGAAGNKGYEAALDAVEMANLYRSLDRGGGPGRPGT